MKNYFIQIFGCNIVGCKWPLASLRDVSYYFWRFKVMYMPYSCNLLIAMCVCVWDTRTHGNVSRSDTSTTLCYRHFRFKS
jgi:hypothetical protein